MKDEIKAVVPYIIAVFLVFVFAMLFLWYTSPDETLLPDVYSVM